MFEFSLTQKENGGVKMKKHENLIKGYSEGRSEFRCQSYSSNFTYCRHYGALTERASLTSQPAVSSEGGPDTEFYSEAHSYGYSYGTVIVKSHQLQDNEEVNNDEN